VRDGVVGWLSFMLYLDCLEDPMLGRRFLDKPWFGTGGELTG
jgi:hypothetical protein